MKNNFALSGIVFVSLIFVLAQSAYATSFPCAFGGTVTVNGNPIAGEQVTAYLNGTGVLVGEGKNTSAGYGISIVDASDQYVFFKVMGTLANEGLQNCVEGTFTQLNLTVDDGDNDGYNVLEDCNDSNAAVNPGAAEICNGIDDNCNGVIDEGFSDLNTSCTVGIGGCARTGVKICSADKLSVVCSVTAGAPSYEACGDGIDNDCNGLTDEICGGGGGGGGGGGSSAYCGDGNLQKYRGEECELNIACNGTGLTCNLTSCKCVECTESWACGEWGQCAGGVQTRTCVDANTCGTVLQKPSESQTCTGSGSSGTQITNLGAIVCGNGVCNDGETCENCPADCQCAGANAQENQGFNILGVFTGAPGLSLLGLLALAIIIAILFFTTRKKKKK